MGYFDQEDLIELFDSWEDDSYEEFNEEWDDWDDDFIEEEEIVEANEVLEEPSIAPLQENTQVGNQGYLIDNDDFE